MIVTFGEFVIAMFLMYTYFGLQIVGDPTPLLVATILYAFCVSSFGNMVGAAIPNQAAAIQAVALGGFLLVFLLSGLIFPISNIPEQIRWLSSIVWGRYYIEIVRDALLKGGGWAANWFGVAMIGMIGSVFYWRAWKTLRKMQLSY
jgi:ABC-2 type transport system permease protein